jgi:hypothetical protein
MRRAIRQYFLIFAEVCSQSVPLAGPGLRAGRVASGLSAHWYWEVFIQLWVLLALPLLVTRI